MTLAIVRAFAMVLLLADRWHTLPCVLAESDEAPSTEEKPAEMTEAEALALRQKVEAAEAKAADALKKSQDSGQAVWNGVAKLRERVKEMKAALAEQGEDADPADRERVERLEDEIRGIEQEFSQGDLPSSSAMDEKVAACVIMSMRHTGMQSKSTIAALRAVAENTMSLAVAAQTDLWRMTSLCISGFTQEEFYAYTDGSLTSLPEKYVEASKTPEAQQQVMSLDANVWKLLQTISEHLLKQLHADDALVPLPTNYGLLALIPLCLGLIFLGKLFRDMQRRQDEKLAKKAKKDAKKSR